MNETDLIAQDKLHRQLALDPRKSFIVQAPAGSGKTELLIQRFLVLLAVVKTPEEILAITFTKRAANEMRSRVIKALKQALDGPAPESDHAKLTNTLAKKVLEKNQRSNWNLIDNPNQLKIQTIDSLCSFITKQLPLLSHFGSQPDISDHPVELYREAIQDVLLHLDENDAFTPSFTQLLLHLDNDLNRLQDLLINLLAKRDQWLPYVQLGTHNTLIKQQLEAQLQTIISEALTKIKNMLPYTLVPELLAIARFAGLQLQKAKPQASIGLANLTNLPGTTADQLPAWLEIANLLLTKSFSWRKRVNEEIGFPALKSLTNFTERHTHQQYRERFSALLDTLQLGHETLRIALVEIFFLPSPSYSHEQWKILNALLEVLKVVAAQLRITFKHHGQIDFIENMQASLVALGEETCPTDLALAMDYQIQHILVDEFQDTSFTQYRLLEKLTYGWEPEDGRSLFIVGDPMQSIYRFREAEVGLFLRLRKKGIHHITLNPLTLSVNFRSTPALIAWNNRHFHDIFPQFDDMGRGAVSFSLSVAKEHSKVPLQDHSEDQSIEARGFVNAPDEAQAKYIIALIQELKAKHPDDNIAILVRSRSHLAAIVPALKQAKVPYHAVDIDLLASRQHIQDLLSLTCALLHPADRIAWLSILRAPWCGLTLADLLILAGNGPDTALHHRLQNGPLLKQLSTDGFLRVKKIIPVLNTSIANRERQDLRTWIENTWLLLGGPAFLADPMEIDDARAFFQLLEKLQEKSPLINVDQLKEQTYRLFATAKQDGPSLQIMTIHSSKGLEFDTVILPHLEKKNPNDDKSLLQWMERPLMNDQTALLLASIPSVGPFKDPIYEYIHREQRARIAHETGRLFYVAATRAKKRLHLFFNINSKEDNEYQITSSSFLEKIWPQWVRNQNVILSRDHLQENNKSPVLEVPRTIQRAQANWINPLMNRSKTENTATHKSESGFHLHDKTPQVIGTITHRILQLLSVKGTAWWTNHTENEKNSYVAYTLKQFSAPPEKMAIAITHIMQIIQKVLNDERGKWILYPHHQAKSEHAMTVMVKHQPQSYIIDRTFIDEEGYRWIIDFKSSGASFQDMTHQSVEKFIEKEKEKYQEQMQKYAAAFTLLERRPIRLALYFPALPAWHEWE